MDGGRYEHFGRCLDACESPAEGRFLHALLFGEHVGFEPTHDDGAIAVDPFGVRLHQQREIDRYVVDFAFTHPLREAILAIEIDGVEFHERTIDQARRDRARDRTLLALGWPTIRFLANEVKWTPFGCAMEALRLYHRIAGLAAGPGLAKATLRVQEGETLALPLVVGR
jgi:very-short-patch-repair endonuclease